MFSETQKRWGWPSSGTQVRICRENTYLGCKTAQWNNVSMFSVWKNISSLLSKHDSPLFLIPMSILSSGWENQLITRIVTPAVHILQAAHQFSTFQKVLNLEVPLSKSHNACSKLFCQLLQHLWSIFPMGKLFPKILLCFKTLVRRKKGVKLKTLLKPTWSTDISSKTDVYFSALTLAWPRRINDIVLVGLLFGGFTMSQYSMSQEKQTNT